MKTVERGYGQEHKATRAYWAPIVAAGNGFCHEVVCIEPSRWIRPGTPWHLAHTADRTAYRGPAHARCNTSEAGRRGNPVGRPKKPRFRPWKPTRDW